MKVLLTFYIPHGTALGLTTFTKRIRNKYDACSAYYKKESILEVSVDLLHKNNVVHLAMAHNYQLLHE